DGAEDARAEQSVALRLEGPVVDRLGLLDLAVGPRENLVRARDRDADLVEDLSRHLRAEKIHHFLVHSSSPCVPAATGNRMETRLTLVRPGPALPEGPAKDSRRGLLRRLCGARPALRLLWPLLLGVVQVDVEAERAHLLDQHVERFRNAGLERVVAAHDRL